MDLQERGGEEGGSCISLKILSSWTCALALCCVQKLNVHIHVCSRLPRTLLI